MKLENDKLPKVKKVKQVVKQEKKDDRQRIQSLNTRISEAKRDQKIKTGIVNTVLKSQIKSQINANIEDKEELPKINE